MIAVCNYPKAQNLLQASFYQFEFSFVNQTLWFWGKNRLEITVISHRFSMNDTIVSCLTQSKLPVYLVCTNIYHNTLYFTELWIRWTLAFCRTIYKGKQQCRERRVVQQCSWSFSGNLPSSRRNGRSQVKYTYTY